MAEFRASKGAAVTVPLEGRTAMVTGGSSGIGRAVARRLAGLGMRVVVVSNVPEELEETAEELGEAGVALEAEFADARAVTRVVPEAESRAGPLYLLVNNAGIGLHGGLLEMTAEDLRRVMEVNFFAAATLCRDALQRMGPRREGHIINVTSASARRALERMDAYAASKAALHALTQALRLEAAPLGVRVSEILPISVATPFFERAGYRPQGWVQTADQVARLIVECARHPRAEICTSFWARVGLALDALAPNFTAWLLGLRCGSGRSR